MPPRPGRKAVLISFEQFQRHAAEGHTRIPVVREVLSDLDTPLSVYLKLADAPHTYLFESVEGGERFGRYSIIGLPARRVISFRGHTLEIREGENCWRPAKSPIPSPKSKPCAPRTRYRGWKACRASPAAWSAGSVSNASATSSRA